MISCHSKMHKRDTTHVMSIHVVGLLRQRTFCVGDHTRTLQDVSNWIELSGLRALLARNTPLQCCRALEMGSLGEQFSIRFDIDYYNVASAFIATSLMPWFHVKLLHAIISSARRSTDAKIIACNNCTWNHGISLVTALVVRVTGDIVRSEYEDIC